VSKRMSAPSIAWCCPGWHQLVHLRARLPGAPGNSLPRQDEMEMVLFMQPLKMRS
jgi:hypothetical protein